jgi:quercetin dioxygenase-like cupin family protein
MYRKAVMLSVALAVGIAVGVIGHGILVAQQVQITRTILQQKDLEGVEGKEIIMFRVEIAPGASLGRHYHSGPELFYVMEGSMAVEVDGQPPMTLKAGDSGYNPAKVVHDAKNVGSAPAKLVGFWVAEKGEPLATKIQQ